MSSIALFSEKSVLSESGEKYAQIKHHLQAKTVQNSYKWQKILEEGIMVMDFCILPEGTV